MLFDSGNGLTIVTGDASDMIVVDVDALKDKEVGKIQDGWPLFSALIDKHGLPDNTPVAINFFPYS